jgi:hypothetical protein
MFHPWIVEGKMAEGEGEGHSKAIKEKRVSVVRSLKEVITFLAALTFTTAISTLFAGPESGHVRSLRSITYIEWIDFFLLMIGLIRFYHGNFRFLDENYEIGQAFGGTVSVKRKNILHIDYLIILLIAILFSALSFFIKDFSYFVLLYVVIIAVDIFWLYFTMTEKILITDSTGFRVKTAEVNWLHNNLWHFIGFVVFFLFYVIAIALFKRDYLDDLMGLLPSMKFENDPIVYWAIILIFISNAYFDFRGNWELYFPGRTA